MSDDPATYQVEVTRIFDAPVEQVWAAWSEPENVMQWWGPEGFTSPSAEMDFREGGRSLVCMHAPEEFGGQEMYNSWSYNTIVPHSLIEFVLHFTDKEGTRLDPGQLGMPPGVPREVPHSITFRTLDDGRTEMTVTEYGYTTEKARDISLAGTEQCLAKMEALLTSS